MQLTVFDPDLAPVGNQPDRLTDAIAIALTPQ
jgi:hypothetical protein